MDVFIDSMSSSTCIWLLTAVCALISCVAAAAVKQTNIVGVYLAGSGCPGSSISVQVDDRSVTFSYGGYLATTAFSALGTPESSSNCAMTIQLITPPRWRSTALNGRIQGSLSIVGDATANLELRKVEVTVAGPRQGRLDNIVQEAIVLRSFPPNAGFQTFDYTGTLYDLACSDQVPKCNNLRVNVTMELTVRAVTQGGLAVIDAQTLVVDLAPDVFHISQRRWQRP